MGVTGASFRNLSGCSCSAGVNFQRVVRGKLQAPDSPDLIAVRRRRPQSKSQAFALVRGIGR